MKQCNKCSITKHDTEFYKRKASKDGLAYSCIECCSKYKNEYYSIPEKVKLASEAWKKYRREHKEEIQITQKIYRINNKEKIRKTAKIHSAKIADKNKIKCKEWYIKNKDRSNTNSKKWAIANKARYDEIQRKSKAKALSDPIKRINKRIATAIWRTLSGSKGGHHSENLLEFTVSQLRLHLEKQFEPWMNWENYGEWHVDHKIPVAAFNFQTPQDLDFKRCWALKNLQPLAARKNISKGARIEVPFQPSLLI